MSKLFYLDMQLPTGFDILQHLIYNQQCQSTPLSSIIACILKNFLRCSGCCCECILSKIKRPLIKTGFDVLTDLSIVEKLFNLHKSCSKLKKMQKGELVVIRLNKMSLRLK